MYYDVCAAHSATYVNEFTRALDLDPNNLDLRRELAFLPPTMGKQPGRKDSRACYRDELVTACLSVNAH